MKFRISKILFFILGLVIVLIGSYFVFFTKQEKSFGEPIFIIEHNEVWQLDFDWDGKSKGRQLTNDGFEKSLLKVAPDQRRVGYYKHLYSKPIYQDEVSYHENYLALMVYSLDTGEEQEVFRGDYRFGNWEWLNPREAVLYRGCGTECVVFWRVDIETGEKDVVNYGVRYEWSPNKELVVAHHYSGGYGITVGDKYGNTLFEFRRLLPSVYSKLTDETKATWSEDGRVLSLTIKKENEEKLEVIKFDVDNNFKIISQEEWSV